MQGFLGPCAYHLTLLVRLIGIRLRTARVAKTTLEVSRALYGWQPSGYEGQPPPEEDEGTGLHIKSDSLSLLAMVVTLYVLGLMCIVLILLSMRYRLDDP